MFYRKDIELEDEDSCPYNTLKNMETVVDSIVHECFHDKNIYTIEKYIMMLIYDTIGIINSEVKNHNIQEHQPFMSGDGIRKHVHYSVVVQGVMKIDRQIQSLRFLVDGDYLPETRISCETIIDICNVILAEMLNIDVLQAWNKFLDEGDFSV